MSEIPPTLPFRIQAAYGNQPSIRPSKPAGVSKLVAGQVEGKVSFKAQDSVEISSKPAKPAAVARDVLAMYRNPMEKNAVATAVLLGRKLDTKG